MERDFVYCNIFGTKGAALLNPFRVHRIVRGKMIDATPPLRLRDSYLASFRIQLSFFGNAIMGKGRFPFSWADGIKIANIIDAFYRSATSGKEVGLS